ASLQNIFKIPELRTRIAFTLTMLAVYRIGAHVPTPGINNEELSKFLLERGGSLLGFLDIFSGGALSRLTIFALGIMPYISASIILQLLTVVIPQLSKLAKEGERGRKKIIQYTRYGTIGIALIQGFGIAVVFVRLGVVAAIVFLESGRRKIPVQYAKRVIGRRVYGGQSTHIPLKINTAGVIPPIFASSIIGFPATIAGFFENPWVKSMGAQLAPGSLLYTLLYVGLIVFF